MFSAQCFVFCLFSRWFSNNQGEFYVNPRGDLQSDCYSSHSIGKGNTGSSNVKNDKFWNEEGDL